MFIYLFKIILCFNLIVIGIGLIEYLYRFLVSFLKLYKTKFPFAKGFKPFIGHLNLIQSGQCPFLFSKLGHGKTYCAFRGSHPCLITSDPKLIKEICIKYADHFHSRMIDPLAPDAYHSSDVHVFGARGLRWKRIRTISSLALKTSQLRKMLPIIFEQTDDFINYLSNILCKRASYKTDIHALFQKLTASVIGRCALGLNKNQFDDPPTHFNLFKQVFGPEPKINNDCETFQWIIPFTTKFYAFLKQHRKSKTPIDQLNEYIGNLLEKKKIDHKEIDFLQQFKQVEDREFNYANETAKNDDNGILRLDKRLKTDKMNTKEIISNTRFLSIAGFDTTANTLSFACFLLAENPEKLRKVFDEIDCTKDDLNYDALNKLEYVNAVILETLRLFPHASMLQSRICLSDCVLDNGTLIQRGIGILFDTWGIHRDKSYWGLDVDEFKPERHFSYSSSFPEYFTPFGVGPRQCIGMRFALMEQKAVIIRFFKHFTVKLPPDISSKNLYISLRNTGTVWPKDLQLIIERRNIVPARP